MSDTRKTKALGKLLFKLETRSKSGSNRKLLFTMFSYMLPGLFLPFLLAKQNCDPTGFEFTFLTYLFYSLILSFTIITELDNLVISKAEIDIFTAMPIEDNLIVKAKLYVIIRYVLLVSIPLLLPGSVYYYWIMKSFPRATMYFVAGFMMCLFIVYILILLYSIALRNLKVKRIGSITLIFQMILILSIIIGYQFISYGITKLPQAGVHNYISILQKKNIIQFLPQSWFALLPARNNYIPDFALMSKIVLPVFICFMGGLSLKYYLNENYSKIREKFIYSRAFKNSSETSKSRFAVFGVLTESIKKVYLRNNLEKSSFGLMQSMFRQDKTVKISIIPMIIIPAGLAVFALITNQLPPPFDRNYFEIRPVFHISILLSVLVVLNTGILGIKVTNYPGASWIYSAYPIDAKKRFKNGVRKFFTLYLLIPVSVLLLVIYAFKMPFAQALIHTLFIFICANLYNSLFNLFSKTLPFTKENTILNSIQRIGSILFPFLYGTVMIMVQLFVYKSIPDTLLAILILIFLNFWLNYFAFIRFKPKPAI